MSNEGHDFDGDEDELDELMTNVAAASHRDDLSERECAQALLTWVARHGNVPQREEAIGLIAQTTDFNKTTAKEWYDEINSQTSLAYLDVNEVVQIKTYGDDDDVFEFHVTANGGNEAFRIESSALMSPKAFQTKVFEVCNIKIEFEDWSEQLNTWMQDATVRDQKAAPIEVEHDIARDLVKNVGESEATYEYEEFKADPSKVYLEDGEVWVRPEMVSSTLSSHSADITRERLQNVMDEHGLLAGNSHRVRTDEDILIRAWKLSEAGLDETSLVDMDQLHASAEDDAT